MLSSEAQRTAMMQAALRVLVMKAGGTLTITREDYDKYVKPDIHFHMFRNGPAIELITRRADQCMFDDEKSGIIT